MAKSSSMKFFLTILAVVCLALPAFGKTHVIWVLGTQPLFEKSESRAQFLALVRKHPEREKQALQMLGIDRETFERGMRSAQSVVTGGLFHLDEMAYYSGGVKVVRDVEVPKDTWMWVVHTPHKTIYVPQLCGNISIVAVAGVESYATSFPITTHQRPAAPHTPVIAAPSPQVAQATSAPFATPAPPATVHHGGFPWWIFLLPVALIHGSSHSSSLPPPIIVPPVHSPSPSPSPSVSATPCPTPTPKPTPTPCPTKSSH